jgi:hypothetical protein
MQFGGQNRCRHGRIVVHTSLRYQGRETDERHDALTMALL